ncbi:MAG: EAL domain-containing protein, partial [Rhodospirillaceae bacterium]
TGSTQHLVGVCVNPIGMDGSFVRTVGSDAVNRAVVKAVVDVATVMGLRTVGEFVEDEATLNLLREIGIDFAQGYVVEKPRPLAAKCLNLG